MILRWSETAVDHLEAIWNYIARDKTDAATELVSRIVGAAEQLAVHPHIGRPGRVKGTREFVVPPFLISYRIRKDAVTVEAVIHGSRVL